LSSFNILLSFDIFDIFWYFWYIFISFDIFVYLWYLLIFWISFYIFWYFWISFDIFWYYGYLLIFFFLVFIFYLLRTININVYKNSNHFLVINKVISSREDSLGPWLRSRGSYQRQGALWRIFFDLSKTGIFVASILLGSYQRQGSLWRSFFRLINLYRGVLTYQSWIGLSHLDLSIFYCGDYPFDWVLVRPVEFN